MILSVTDGHGKLLESHTYDDADRALTSYGPYGAGDVAVTYSAAGQTQVSDSMGHTTNYASSYVGGHMVVNSVTGTYQGTSYTYDANGNTLTKTNSAGTTSYTWDYENRLTSATLPGTGGTVYFTYDPFGRRVQKISPSAGTTIYTYDGDNEVSQLTATGGLIVRFTHGLGIDEPLAEQKPTRTLYTEADALGSVTTHTDTTGNLVDTFTFDSFGFVEGGFDPATDWYLYTGRELDTETVLYYYRARYYDPQAGRFLSEDPIGFKGGVNFYRYTANNPIIFRDPSGLLVGCFYAQNTGHMVCYDADTGDEVVNTFGYAGGNLGKNPGGVNNPDEQYVPYVGPIPQGFYNIGTNDGRISGGYSLPLTPILWTDLKGRGGFYIHADTRCQCQSASEGCIVIPTSDRKIINDAGGGSLDVIPNENKVVWPKSVANILATLGL